MNTFFVKQWEENKGRLEKYFRATKQEQYDNYAAIVKKLFELCIPKADDYGGEWNLNKMSIIDDGDYQGTEIFIIPRDTYQPSVDDYVMIDNYYGSCSGCDTLQSISSYDYDIPTEKQVVGYMTLALHLVQRIKKLGIDE